MLPGQSSVARRPSADRDKQSAVRGIVDASRVAAVKNAALDATSAVAVGATRSVQAVEEKSDDRRAAKRARERNARRVAPAVTTPSPCRPIGNTANARLMIRPAARVLEVN
jgi:hypothetical protein